MLSRVASQLYWYGRYVERAENTARLVRVNSNLLLDLPGEIELGWAPLVEIMGLDAEFAKLKQEPSEDNVVRFLILDADNPSSVLRSLESARSNLRSCREIVSREIWERTNYLYLMVRDEGKAGMRKRQRHDFLSRIATEVNTATGLLYSTMAAGLAFDFIRIGSNLERADMTTRILDIRTDDLLPGGEENLTPFASIQWMSVLKSLSAFQLYRQTMRTRVNGPDVLRYLIQHDHHPRSVLFCLSRLNAALGHLPRSKPLQEEIAKLRKRIESARMDRLVKKGLPEFVDSVQLSLSKLSNAISETYFS